MGPGKAQHLGPAKAQGLSLQVPTGRLIRQSFDQVTSFCCDLPAKTTADRNSSTISARPCQLHFAPQPFFAVGLENSSPNFEVMSTNLFESLKLLAHERICLSCYMSYIEVWLPEKLVCLCSHLFSFQFHSQAPQTHT